MTKLKFLGIIALAIILMIPEFADARRGGGSFGGFRGSRSFARPSSPTRSMPSSPSGVSRSRTSFGGTRTTRADYSSKYGTPRRTSTYTGTSPTGGRQNYIVNDYGGYSSGLMMGYMQGSIASHMMWLPWYGAFWYTRPYYSEPDINGNVEVYPPTFNYTKLIIVILIVGLIAYWIYSRIKRRRYADETSQSSFG
jgi:hypothetical protein